MYLLGMQSYFHITHDVVTWKPRVECRFVVADLVRLCVTGFVVGKKYWGSRPQGWTLNSALLLGIGIGLGSSLGYTLLNWDVRDRGWIEEARSGSRPVNATASSTQSERLI